MNLPFETLPFLFFVIAFVYSMVGFGGGSSYLLVLTLAGLSHTQSVPIALLCNLVVTGVGFWGFVRAGYFNWRLALPFSVLSVPMAFLGAKIPIGKELFLFLLAFSLALAALRILFLRDGVTLPLPGFNGKKAWIYGLPIGGIIGFFSGLIGLGGGIFLSPILILTRWAQVRQASAAACFFIFINSLSGLAGKLHEGLTLPDNLVLYMVPAFLGGVAGSWLGTRRVSSAALGRVLAFLTLFVSINLFIKLFA